VLEPQQSTSVVLPRFVQEKKATIAEIRLATAPPPAFLPTPDAEIEAGEPAESLYTPPPRYALPPHERFTPSTSAGATPQFGLSLVPPLSSTPVPQRSREFVPVYDFAPPPAEMEAATVPAWSMAFLPVLQFLGLWVTINVLQLELGDLARYALLATPALIYILIAYADRKTLLVRDFEQLPSPFVAIVPPIYFVLRAIRVGVSGLLPLFVWLALEVAAIAGLVWQGVISLAVFGL
jgi:hypothetical protein